jgi:hypothetical protein
MALFFDGRTQITSVLDHSVHGNIVIKRGGKRNFVQFIAQGVYTGNMAYRFNEENKKCK